MHRAVLTASLVSLMLAGVVACEDGPNQTPTGVADRCAHAEVASPCTDTSGKDCVLTLFGGGVACTTHVRCGGGEWKRTGEGTCDGDMPSDAGTDAADDGGVE